MRTCPLLHYAFNGDADGLCALQQLRLVDPRPATLVTGVKRDVALLRRVAAKPADEVTVLDVSLEANRGALMPMLEAGVSVRWIDHHHAGFAPEHVHFESLIDTSADVCTSLLVDHVLGGRYRSWAIAATFGDGLKDVANCLCLAAGLSADRATVLERLGIGLNYNAYGESLPDLHIDPAALAAHMRPFECPFEFARKSSVFESLFQNYLADMEVARRLQPRLLVPGAAVVIMPDEAWARRAIGTLANELMCAWPDCGIALLSRRSAGGYTVSVRAPAGGRAQADALCLQFATGGGRRGAAGINELPASEVDAFVARFEAHFGLG